MKRIIICADGTWNQRDRPTIAPTSAPATASAAMNGAT
jgi:hypothetical protein